MVLVDGACVINHWVHFTQPDCVCTSGRTPALAAVKGNRRAALFWPNSRGHLVC